MESGKHLDSLAHLPPRDSQVFHIDPYDHPMVDGDRAGDAAAEGGPLQRFCPRRFRSAPRASSTLCCVAPIASATKRSSAAGERKGGADLPCAGTVLFIDTSRCFHYGARNGEEASFPNPRRASRQRAAGDFSQILDMSEPEYTIRPGDSRLRKLVLDRRAGSAQ